MTEPTWDRAHLEWVVPHTCPCCHICWLIVKGKRAGKCVHNGPYLGYVEIGLCLHTHGWTEFDRGLCAKCVRDVDAWVKRLGEA